MTYISESLRRLVEERANYKCEYCQIQSDLSFYPHEVDHVIALKHRGETRSENLAYACWRCNRYKGSDLGSFDPQTNEFRFLFNPRTQRWNEHYQSPHFFRYINPEVKSAVQTEPAMQQRLK